MLRRIKYICIVWMLLTSPFLMAQAHFFNLTANDVKIDSVLPYFSHSFELNECYADSIYTVSILYPEFIDMTTADVARYQQLSSAPLPALPIPQHKIAVNRKRGLLQVGFSPLVYRNHRYQILVSFMLRIEAKPLMSSMERATAKTRASSTNRYADHSVLASGKWAKIRVPSTGVYQLTDELIRQAGFTDLQKVKVYGYGGRLQNEQLVSEELIATDDLKEVPTCWVDGRRLFYAYGTVSWESNTATRRTRNPYSDTGYYFLTQSEDAPVVLDSTAFIHSFYPSPDYYHTLYEVDGYSWYHGGRNLFHPKAIDVAESATYTIPSLASKGKAKMAVNVSAGSASRISVMHNEKQLGELAIALSKNDKGNETSGVYQIERTSMTDTVKLTTRSGSPSRLDYISFIWPEPFPAPHLKGGSFPVPEFVQAVTNQDLHAHGFADMVIIIPSSQKLKAQAERLKAFHEKHDGLRVQIVSANQLYNEFSSGTPDANAYRRYLKMLYDRATTAADMPKYLLLFGDCVWDNRMLTAQCQSLHPDDYLLCFESENSFNEVYCFVDDGFFCALDDGEGLNKDFSDQQDIAVGRFPVTTEADAKVMVDKVIAYVTNKDAGAWQNTLVFMGDDGDNNLHMQDIDKTANAISSQYPSYLVKKIMWDAYQRETSSSGNTYPEVSRIIKQQQAAGALIMDYGGHGMATQISHEKVLNLHDFQTFQHPHLPLWITASCDIMPFDGETPTIGEVAVRNPRGGAISFFGTTRTVIAHYNARINTSFLRYVLSKDAHGNPVTIGEAQRLAKNEMITSRKDLTCNKLQYALLGDPAVALHQPSYNIVVDSINGKALASTPTVALQAGSTVTVKGHIEGVSDFQGLVFATVRDNEEKIMCRRNDQKETKEALTFMDRPRTLYNGANKVENGKFSFVFAVPSDINYSEGSGKLNLYAISDNHQMRASGVSEAFTLGGGAELKTDSLGPSIYCYLNSPSFVNGGNVNSTPYFVAEIKDDDGINVSGSGIGHDLQLIIDGDMSKSYNLNANFTYNFGSYTAGSTFYQLPELAPGPHQLLFRAWDVLNNPSTTKLSFNVVRGMEPQLFSIDCTNNPAREATTFILEHDRAGAVVDVEIEVFDLSGRLLWHHQESSVSTTNTQTVNWNLTVENGNRLQTGVYLYRARISSEGSAKVSKAKKLIVVSNN